MIWMGSSSRRISRCSRTGKMTTMTAMKMMDRSRVMMMMIVSERVLKIMRPPLRKPRRWSNSNLHGAAEAALRRRTSCAD